MDNIVKTHLALLVTTLIYAGNYTVAKEVMPEYIQPFGLIFMRVCVALVLYWVLHLCLIREEIDKKDIPKLALCGLCGVAINQLMFFKGLSLTTPINASLIMTTNPVLVLLIANMMLKEPITKYKLTGVIMGATGAIILILFGKKLSFQSETLLGDLLICINAMSFGMYLVMVKPLMDKYNPVTVIKWVFLFGSIIVIPCGFEEFMAVDFNTFPAKVWYGLLYILIGTTFIAYLLNNFALKMVNPSVVSTYIYLQPCFATIIALIFDKDQLTVLKTISSIFIFSGVFLVSKSPKIQIRNKEIIKLE